MVELLSGIAAQAGYEARGYTSAKAFLADIGPQSADLILLDLGLDDSDGVEVLRQLGERGCRAPITIMTGFDDRVAQSAVAFGRSIGLTMLPPTRKPFDAIELERNLRQQGDRMGELSERDLAQAIRQRQIVVHYQPIIQLRTGRLIGAEALARWQHPTRGLLSPDKFIPMAEAGSQMLPLTLAVVEQACADVAQVERGMWVSVNVSRASLADPHLPDHIHEVVRRSGIATQQVGIEITETAAMGDPALTTAAVTRLRIKGFQVSLDDFGTGYSSLVELHRMPVSKLKIDKSFVGNLPRDEAGRTITQAIVGLARALKLEVVAEGVEDEETAKLLTQMGCDYAQGYAIGRPMPLENFGRWIADWRQSHRATA
jgi:EAL domain-containing protein (putative c-di-GMP-specific phosphodiesterase class I)